MAAGIRKTLEFTIVTQLCGHGNRQQQPCTYLWIGWITDKGKKRNKVRTKERGENRSRSCSTSTRFLFSHVLVRIIRTSDIGGGPLVHHLPSTIYHPPTHRLGSTPDPVALGVVNRSSSTTLAAPPVGGRRPAFRTGALGAACVPPRRSALGSVQ